jgi:hypothetical protein
MLPMPTLPLIDLMILVAWTSLIVGGVEKLIGLALNSRPLLLGMAPIDFVMVAGVCLLFALSLAARVWVRAHEPALLRARHAVPRRDEGLAEAPGAHANGPAGEGPGERVLAGGR